MMVFLLFIGGKVICLFLLVMVMQWFLVVGSSDVIFRFVLVLSSVCGVLVRFVLLFICFSLFVGRYGNVCVSVVKLLSMMKVLKFSDWCIVLIENVQLWLVMWIWLFSIGLVMLMVVWCMLVVVIFGGSEVRYVCMVVFSDGQLLLVSILMWVRCMGVIFSVKCMLVLFMLVISCGQVSVLVNWLVFVFVFILCSLIDIEWYFLLMNDVVYWQCVLGYVLCGIIEYIVFDWFGD